MVPGWIAVMVALALVAEASTIEPHPSSRSADEQVTLADLEHPSLRSSRAHVEIVGVTPARLEVASRVDRITAVERVPVRRAPCMRCVNGVRSRGPPHA